MILKKKNIVQTDPLKIPKKKVHRPDTAPKGCLTGYAFSLWWTTNQSFSAERAIAVF